MTAFRTILAKDLRVELRTLESVPAMALFAAIIAVNRLFVAEREEGGFDAIRLAPVDMTALWAAKAVALFVYLLALELIAVPIFAAFFLDSWSGIGPLLAVLLLMDVGLGAVGALVSSLAASSRARDLVGPLVLLPLLVPLMIAAANAAEPLLAAGGPSYADVGTWLLILALYDLTFAAIGYAVFDFVVED